MQVLVRANSPMMSTAACPPVKRIVVVRIHVGEPFWSTSGLVEETVLKTAAPSKVSGVQVPGAPLFNVPVAQQALYHRAKCNQAARRGHHACPGIRGGHRPHTNEPGRASSGHRHRHVAGRRHGRARGRRGVPVRSSPHHGRDSPGGVASGLAVQTFPPTRNRTGWGARGAIGEQDGCTNCPGP